jgi:hypothetical protein
MSPEKLDEIKGRLAGACGISTEEIRALVAHIERLGKVAEAACKIRLRETQSEPEEPYYWIEGEEELRKALKALEEKP